MNHTPAITVQNVCKTFRVLPRKDTTVLYRLSGMLGQRGQVNIPRSIDALRDIRFTVNRGEVLGVIGTNTSGKSTLLRILAGILKADSGSVDMRGRITALMDLSASLQSTLSMRDNITLACLFFGIPRSSLPSLLPSIMEFAEGQMYLDMYPFQISNGMRQRILFSAAMHTTPEILLLDEVFSAGDIGFRARAMRKMKDVIRNVETTVVMVSHDPYEIRSVCDRVLWLEGGRMRQIGQTEDVLNAYTDYVTQSAVASAG